MKVYIKEKNKNLWHWELECPLYPEISEVVRVYGKPPEGEFCSICRQIEAEGANKSSSKEVLGDDIVF